MIIEKLENNNNLTDSEKLIANYLLNKETRLEGLTSTELGKQSFSSQSAVIRLYKKLGIKNYREFITTLAIERKEYFRTQDLQYIDPKDYFSSYENTIDTVNKLYEKIMINANLNLDKNIVIRVCNRILNSNDIEIYGFGLSNTVAKQLSYRFQYMGMNSSCFDDVSTVYISKIKEPNKKVVILVSLSEYQDHLKQFIQILKQKGIYTIIITDKQFEQDLDMKQDCLLFDKSLFSDMGIMSSVYSCNYIIDLLCALLTSRIENK